MEERYTKTIRIACDNAVSTYHQYMKTVDDDITYTLFKTEYDRLKIWAGNIGVYALSPASADDRLHDDDELRKLVLDLLTKLTDLLCRPRLSHEESGTPEVPASSDSSLSSVDGGNQETQMKLVDARLLRRVRNIASQLFSVLILVRQPANLSSNEKVFSYDFQSDLAEDFSSLITDYTNYIDFYLKRTFRSAASDNECVLPPNLLLSLKEGAVIRRKALLLKAQHRRKLRGNVAAKFAALSPRVMKADRNRPVDVEQHHSGRSTAHAPSEANSRVMSATVPSTAAQPIQRSKDKPHMQTPPNSSKSVILLRSRLDIPRPPEFGPDKLEVECYICGLGLEETSLQVDHWKKHVLRDIDPFVCLFQCSKPDVLYKTPEEWYKHMQEHRMEWCCMIPAHRNLTFKCEDELENHLVTDHGASMSTAQRALLLRRGKRALPRLFDDCPLCGKSVDDIQAEVRSNLSPTPSNQESITKLLQRHLEGHMYDLALLAILPHPNLVTMSQSAVGIEGSEDKAAKTVEHRLADEGLKLLPRDVEDPQEHVLLDQDFHRAERLQQIPTAFYGNSEIDKSRIWAEFVDEQAPPPDLSAVEAWAAICETIWQRKKRNQDANWHDSDIRIRTHLCSRFERRRICPPEAQLQASVWEGLCTNARIYVLFKEVMDVVDVVISPPIRNDERLVTFYLVTAEAAADALANLEDFEINGQKIKVRQSGGDVHTAGGPLSINANAVSLISLGLQTTEYLYQYYNACREQGEDLAETADRLEDLVDSLQIIDAARSRIFRPNEQKVVRIIETSITNCHDTIFKLQEEARKHFKESGDSLTGIFQGNEQRTAYPLQRTTLEKLEEDINGFRESISAALQALGGQEQRDTKHDIPETKRIIQHVQAQNLASSVRAWLEAPYADIELDAACAKRHVGTGQWFIQSTIFTTWLQQKNSFRWLRGKPGCGKTILCATIIQHAFSHIISHPGGAIAFFFFTFANGSKQDASAMLRTLLLQLSGQISGLDTHLRQLYESYKTNVPPMTVLIECLRWAITRTRNVCIVLDALDEISDPQNVLTIIETMRGWRFPGLHLLVASRHIPYVRVRLHSLNHDQNETHIAMSLVDVQVDIRKYVSYQVDHDPQFRRWGNRCEMIKQYLTQGAEGVFLWVVCTLSLLRQCPPSVKDIEAYLAELPQYLDATYERMLYYVSEKSRNDAQWMLSLLCLSSRPLCVDEVIEALDVDVDGFEHYHRHRKLRVNDLLRICPGLVELSGRQAYRNDYYSGDDDDGSADDGNEEHQKDSLHSQVIRIAHFSMKDYLTSPYIERSSATMFAISQPEQQVKISEVCILYLCHDEFLQQNLTQSLVQRYALAQYAARYWHYHYRRADGELMERLVKRAVVLLTTDSSRDRWIRLYDPDHEEDERVSYYGTVKDVASSTYYASLLGLDQVVESILSGPQNYVNAQGGKYGNALQAAAAGGYKKVVQMLLDAGAEVNAQGGVHKNALQAASAGGYENVVRLLVERGAGINAQGGYYDTALQAASAGGYEKVVQLLIERGADINAQGGSYDTALQAASAGGYENVVRLLVERGAGINAQGGSYDTALQAASAGGYENVVRLLVERGADVNAQGGYYDTALQAASAGGYEKVVQLLVERGADVNAQGGEHGNALQAASAGGYENVVRLLIERGADINAQGGYYDTALQAASAGGYENVVRLLVEQGADVNAQGGRYGNALQAASAAGHKEIVKLLLKAGAAAKPAT